MITDTNALLTYPTMERLIALRRHSVDGVLLAANQCPLIDKLHCLYFTSTLGGPRSLLVSIKGVLRSNLQGWARRGYTS